ncbi:TPA: hypothetical protein RK250_000806 [Klebsiella oxytoca]|uniref:hypothetical protein n=1 Tax=Klebsiella oxytoca TaxID=571 RepID=UPI0021E5FE9D|nr:hypothetical protein [Klebsiella oxytoca]UYH03512.1 hypothetical protein NQA44_20145 [Klebsiella oxytoca]HDW1387260.1 hypothetical protein [Klebsiella oxytoca]HDW1411489.1 hypothetical protein [Klebsiella oxytoca]
MIDSGTTWRQGQILKHEDAVSLGLIAEGDTGVKVVVISHDCDLQSASEPKIELIAGPLLKGAGNFTRAKHPRILHLHFENASDANLNAIELKHDNKLWLAKETFTCSECDSSFTISSEEKQGLKQWLAARYGRPAFPDVFESRLRAFDAKKFRFEKELAKIISQHSKYLIGVFFDLGEDRFSDLEEGIPYELNIHMVYDAIDGGPEARIEAEQAVAQVSTLFTTYHGEPSESELIALMSCNAVPDTEFTLYALRRMDQWRVEYISLIGDEVGDYINPSI